MPKISFNIAKITTLPFSKKGTTDYSSKKYPNLILRIGRRTKSFYFRVYTATPEFKKGMHLVADVTNRVDFESVVLPKYKEYKEKLCVSKTLLDGFSSVRMRDYLNSQYKIDRRDLNREVSDDTINSLKRYFVHCLDKPCIELTDNDYRKYIACWPNNSESSRRKIYYAFNAMLNTLVEFKRLSINPLKKRQFNNELKSAINVHNMSYTELFSTVLDDNFGKNTKFSRGFSKAIRVMFCTFVHIGARPSEVRLLKLEDLDLSLGNESLHFRGETVKTSKPRKVPITSPLIICALKEFIEKSYIPNKQKYLFYNLTTNQVYSMGCWNALYRSAKKYFALKGRCYDFRHTFASRLYKQTGDIKLVADMIGDDIATASKYYANNIIDTAREKIKLID